MKLTRDQRSKLFNGELPTITFPGDVPCPVAKGHIEELSANVKLEVTEIRRTHDGKHSLGYTLHNQRLGGRFLARQQGQAHPEQYAYSPAAGIDTEAGEAVDEFTQRQFTREAKTKAQRDAAKSLAILDRVEQVLTSQMNGATAGEMKQARSQVKRAKQKIEGQAKALEAAEEGA